MLVSLFSVGVCCLLPLALSSSSAPLLAYLDDSYKPSLPLLSVLSTITDSVQFGPLKRQPQLIDPEDLSTAPTYSSVIIATPSLPSQLSSPDLIEHVRRGGNLMIILAGSEGGESYRQVLKNFGVEPLPGRFQSFSDDHNLSLNQKHALATLFPSAPSAPKSLFGFHLHTDPFKEASFNPLLHPLLSLSPHQGFCTEDACSSTGAAIATLESRTGGRVVLVGAPELASAELLEWMQGTAGKIAVESFQHALIDGEAKNRGSSELGSTVYRVGDAISLKLCMRDSNGNPFSPTNEDDLQYFQAELRLMTIHARLPFQSSSDGCLMIPSLKLPSIPGIYTLRFHLRRPGWSVLSVEERLLVRPFRHDEYERFLGVAGPYYGSWWSLLGATGVVLIPFMLSKALRSNESIEDEKKKTQ